MSRLGILGGTFDPPHIGHLILGEYALDALGFDQLLYLPAADPPHKQGQVRLDAAHRVAMLERAIAGNTRFRLSRLDLDRPGPHYSLDTVRLLHQQHPGAEVYFVMGGDSLRDLPTWHRPQDLMRECRFVVMGRPGDGVRPDMHEVVLPGLAERVMLLDAPQLDISSTAIVERIRQGRSVRYLVPDAVLAYIQEQQIYRDES